MAEEIAREKEGGPGLCASELGVAIPSHYRAYLTREQMREQGARQQNGDEALQADEVFWGSKFIESAAWISLP